VEKPSPGFFDRVIEEAGVAASSVLYVGDRLDNDVRPAQEAGISTALVRRGPWGHILRMPEVEQRCLFHLAGLAELPARVAAHNAEYS